MSFSVSRKYRLDEIGKITTGKTPSTKDKSNFGGDIYFITPGDLQSGKHINKTERYLTEKGSKEVGNCILPRNAICVSCIGTIGYVGLTRSISVTNQQINSITPFSDFDEDFVYYLMKNNWDHFKLLENQSTTLSILNKSQFSKLEFKIPPKKYQTKIAKVLSVLDDKIELNNKINKSLEEMAQAIFKSWFVDFEPFRDGEFIESEHGFIPKGWKVTNFSQYYDYVAGYSYSGDELVSSKTALLTIKNFDRNGGLRNDGFKEINPIKKVKEEKYAKLFDVVVACTDLTQKAEIIGNPLLVTSSAEYESMIFSMDLVKILPTTEMADSCFAYQILKDQRFKGFALKYVSGTTVLHLSKKAFNEYLLPLPCDFEIIQKYVEIVRPMFEKLVEIESENNRLIKVRDSLLPKLMSGEIRVPFEGVPNAELR